MYIYINTHIHIHCQGTLLALVPANWFPAKLQVTSSRFALKCKTRFTIQYIHTHIYMHTHIQTSTHTHTHTYIHTQIHTA